MEEKKKPGRPLSVIYADAKQAITRQVGNTMAAYGLPIFMAEGILSGVLAEIRSNAANELADDTARYEEELKEYYETEAKVPYPMQRHIFFRHFYCLRHDLHFS